MTATQQIAKLHAQIQNERDKAEINQGEHERLLRRHWDAMDELIELRRRELERAARRILK